MVWNEADNLEITGKITELENYLDTRENQTKVIRKELRRMRDVKNGIDLDGSNIPTARRSTLKTSLISKADELMSSNS